MQGSEYVAVAVGLAQLGLTLLLWGTLFTLIAVIVERRLGSAWVFGAWIVLLALLTSVTTIVLHSKSPQAPWVGYTFMFVAFIGVPSGVVALVATRLGRREPK